MSTRYQDLWVNGKALEKGQRGCADRWNCIHGNLLSEYRRDFSLFDLGAATGYFSFRAREMGNCLPIMVEHEHEITTLGRDHRGVVLLHKKMSEQDITSISMCESFDVVLLLNVLHHFKDPATVLSACCNMADWVVVETPSPGDEGACGQDKILDVCDLVKGTRVLGEFPSHTDKNRPRAMRLLLGNEPAIKKSYIGVPAGTFSVEGASIDGRNFESCGKISNTRKVETSDFIPGMNLNTYLKMGGFWPQRSHFLEQVSSIPTDSFHGDIRPWNMIIGKGSLLHLIDFGDWDEPDERRLETTKAMLG